MENTMKMYVTADEAAQILGVSRGYGRECFSYRMRLILI